MKKVISCILAAALVCGASVSCGKKGKNTSTDSGSVVNDADNGAAYNEANVGNGVAANSGDAFLAIFDGDWKNKYWGANTDPLSYDAGVTQINGNGSYTVSVTGNGQALNGVAFMAVIIRDGGTKYPNAVIKIDSIKADGTEIALDKKSYTNTEDGDVRANIINDFVGASLPSDARTTDGVLFLNSDKGTPNSEIDASEYSPKIVDPGDFGEWTTIEVNFTVSGL